MGSWSDICQFECVEWFVVVGEFVFILEDLDCDGWLVVVCCGEGFVVFGWDGCVVFDEFGYYVVFGFDVEVEWGDVDEEDVFVFIFQDIGLQCGVDGDDFVWVDVFVCVFVGFVFDEFGDCGYMC